MSGKTDYCQGHHYWETWPGSSPSSPSTRDWQVLTENRTRAFVVGGDHSSKELLEQLFNNYAEHIHELTIWLQLHLDVGRIALVSPPIRHFQVCMLNVRQNRLLSGSPLLRDLTTVISIIFYYRASETDKSWPGIVPEPSWWEATTLSQSYSNSFLIAIWNIFICPDSMLLVSFCNVR